MTADIRRDSNFVFTGNTDTVSAADLQNAFNNLAEHSSSFATMVQGIRDAHGTVEISITNDPDHRGLDNVNTAPKQNPSDPNEPDSHIRIPQDAFNGDTYATVETGGVSLNEVIHLERLIAHEMYHAFIDVTDPSSTDVDAEETSAIGAENSVMDQFLSALDYLTELHRADHSGNSNNNDGNGRHSYTDPSNPWGGSGDGEDGNGKNSPATPPDGQGPKNQASPIVLDLDGDGIELTALGENHTYFDLKQNGQAVLTGWVDPDDGLLVRDINANGRIDNSGELFGTQSTDGFTVLSALDSNHDGAVNASDTNFGSLKVWQDTNGDGISQEGELHTLGSLNITSINVNAQRVANEQVAGNNVTHTSTFVMNGMTEIAADVWFDYSTQATRNVAEYTPDDRAALLPDLRGYGDIKDLYIAASIDNGSSSTTLMEELKSFANGLDFATAISNWNATAATVNTLMLNWANVDGVSTTGRGNYVDGQHLAFYEKFTGVAFIQDGASNPLPEAGTFVEAIYDNFVKTFTSQLVAQAAGSQIFNGAFYNTQTGGLDGDLSLNLDAVTAIKTAAIASLDPESVWTHFAQFLGYTAGLDGLTPTEITALDNAVLATGEPSISDWSDVVTSMTVNLGSVITQASDWGSFEIFYDNSINGTSGNDTLTDPSTGGHTNNELMGHDGNDTLSGLDGHDKLEGGAGADTLIGGSGDDYVLGGTGNDIYVYESGNDTYSEIGGDGYDELHFASSTNLLQTDITDMYRLGNDMILLLDTGAKITIDNYATAKIEKLVFDKNTSALDLTALLSEKYEGTAGNDDLHLTGIAVQTLTANGEAGNDSIQITGAAANFSGGDGYDTLTGDYLSDQLHGGNGDDYLAGGGGADTLYGDDGNDVLDGGAGNDRLEGSTGVDTYLFGRGYGNDVAYDLDNSFTRTTFDRVRFASDILTFDIRVSSSAANPDDIVLTIKDTGETLTLSKQEFYSLNQAQIGGAQFADGTLWSAADLRAHAILDENTSGNDTIVGFRDNETFAASAGNDLIEGRAGNDLYLFNSSSGYDTVSDLSNSTNDTAQFSSLAQGDFDIYKQNGNLILAGSTYSGGVTVIDYKNASAGQIENFVFSDHTVSGAANILAMITNADGLVINKALSTGGTLNGESTYNDLMIGSAANDTLVGNNGNDVYVMTAGTDVIQEAAGTDTLRIGPPYSIDDLTLTAGSFNLSVIVTGLGTTNLSSHISNPTHSIEYIKFDGDGMQIDISNYGSWLKNVAGSNDITGTSSANTLWGNGVANTLNGLDGNDALYGNGGNDTLNGGNGTDQLSGGAGADVLHGGAGADALYGGGGNDILYGEDGGDVMWGGAGSDTFVMEAVTAYNQVDTIQDFSHATGGDVLNLADLVTAYNPVTDAIANFIIMTSDGAGGTNIAVDRDGTGGTYSAVTVADLHGINLTGLTVQSLVDDGTFAV